MCISFCKLQNTVRSCKRNFLHRLIYKKVFEFLYIKTGKALFLKVLYPIVRIIIFFHSQTEITAKIIDEHDLID